MHVWSLLKVRTPERASGLETALAVLGKNMISGIRVHENREERHQSRAGSGKIFSAVHN